MNFDDEDYYSRFGGRGLAGLGLLGIILCLLFCYVWLLITAITTLTGDAEPDEVSRGPLLLFVWAGWIVFLMYFLVFFDKIDFFWNPLLIIAAPLVAHVSVTFVCSFLPFSRSKFFAIYRIVLLGIPLFTFLRSSTFNWTSAQFGYWLMALILPELYEVFFDIRSFFARRLGTNSIRGD